ncbi:PDGLE domain-containing protein [Myxacorys almedinensis]|uniref:Cobalt transport protein n=1 Tax=Myxacorys almedinensis A TaxID=2690445 RepID=A0A8J7Z5C7_9CYAN|nr:PDGLE domain-containing protein [Myxacorys almedinensis]NDJ16723.1 cobalt transport protein [Myxacorys almedinensis A]
MSDASRTRNRAFVLTGLGISLLIAVFVSPFASGDPDGLDRVSQDQGFDERAVEDPITHRLPFYQLFDEYAVRGVPEQVATPIAGLVGTLAAFGLAWGAGKVLIRNKHERGDEM